MTRRLVWTIRIESEELPFFYLTHEGPQSVVVIQRTVEQMTRLGHVVIVGLKRKGVTS
jgi:hypothetical protein